MTRLALLVALVCLAVAGCAGAPPPLALGVAADSPGEVRRFADRVGAPAGLYQWYAAWEGRPRFDRERAQRTTDLGAVPLLTWEPWTAGGGVDQPRYALARVAAGDHDDYIASYARQVRDWGGVLALRFAHELNAPHYPWSVGVNGNSPDDALAAWRHVRDVFAEQGTDVVWVWSVNVSAPGSADYAEFYPGDDDVDWVGLDGYNGGTALPWGGWQSPEELLGDDLERLDDLSDRPLLLTEVGSTEAGGDKAAWIAELFDLAQERRLRAVVWFDYAKETDWRVASSPQSSEAFRRAVAAEGRVTATPPLPDRLTEGPD
ncbi:MAG: hypothetical protein M3P95_11815 [Actinomycetota bacterium]|nr:hypothetical protein [Actinomycetota bacterium]